MILLTGATGMAGSYIVNEFIKEKVPVRVLVRSPEKAKSLQFHKNLDVVVGDMNDMNSLQKALAGVERVLMISSSVFDMADTQIRFVDACKFAGVKHVIKFSGLDARPETTFDFGLMHLRAERYLEASGLIWTHLRPTGFMQEYLREAPTITEHNSLFLALGESRLSPVDLADVGKIAFKLLVKGGHEGEILPITGPEALGMNEIAEQIGSAVGRKIQYVPIPRIARSQGLLSNGIPEPFVHALDRQVEERLKNGVESQVNLSTHKIFAVQPTSFAEFAKREAAKFDFNGR